MTLTELAIKYACDKYYAHSYIPLYEELFKSRTVRRLLEIGIGYGDLMKPFVPKYVHGASLKMWEEYFPEAEIFACDIRPETLINEGRIRSMVCDQSKGGPLADMVCWCLGDPFTNYFDVIIDDGSHQTADQIFTASCLLPRLNTGGVYVIEDVQEPEQILFELLPIVRRWPINDRLLIPEGFTEPLIVHRFAKRPDDCLVVIQK